MAIAIATEYPNALPANASYPGGSFKNDSTGALGDGTPLDNKWANDFLGFFQGLLATAGMVASGAPDTAVVSQYRDAMEAIMWEPGDYKWCSYSTPGRRWLECNGGSIGNELSGATARANVDTAALFNKLWLEAAYVIQTSAGVVTARGVSSSADFAANKRMVLPDWRGDALRAWAHGRAGVDEDRALGTEQLDAFKAHTHTVAEGRLTGGEGNLTSGDDYTDGIHALQTTSSTGATETRMRNGSAMLVIRY